jgi:hypothetical protein
MQGRGRMKDGGRVLPALSGGVGPRLTRLGDWARLSMAVADR